jgi:hypothetical protein
MKIRVVYLTILLVLMLKIANISNISMLRSNNSDDKHTKEDSKDKGKEHKHEIVPATNIPTNINALGHIVKKETVLTKFPMTIKNCDEVAIFQAQYITDMNDYREKADGWFSLSAYTVNLYQKKDANHLIHSVDLGNLKQQPSYLTGAKGCIQIEGGAGPDITICFSDDATAENLMSVIKTFYSCRRGDNLKPIPKEILKNLVQVCEGEGNLVQKKTAIPTVRPGNKWDADRESFFHPEDIKVPGTV